MDPGEGRQRDFHGAASEYFEALAMGGVPEEQSRRVAEAYASYIQILQDAWAAPELQQRARAAYDEYRDMVAQTWAPAEFAECASSAYNAYIHVLRETWIAVNEERIDPASLAEIASGMLSVAWTAKLATAGVVRKPLGEGG
jgi:hypothetical protein